MVSCFVVLRQFRFCALDYKMILVGLSQGLQVRGPDLHTSEVGHGETSHNGRRLLLRFRF